MDTTILKFEARGDGNKPKRPSGRHSTRAIYREDVAAAQEKRERQSRSGRYSTRAVYRDAGTGDGVTKIVPIEANGPGVATEYWCKLAPRNIARIRTELREDGKVSIDWVFVPPEFRGTGLASQLMRRVCDDADDAAAELILEARACGGPDQQKLEAWYGQFGFAPTGAKGPFGPYLARSARRAAFRRHAA